MYPRDALIQRLALIASVAIAATSSVSEAHAERQIVLPHTEDFSASDSIDDIAWATPGNGAAVTRVQGSWRGASDYCARIDPPTDTLGGQNGLYAALGAFHFTATNTLNVAFALNVGTTYSSSAADSGGSLINKFIDIFDPDNRAGLLGLNNRGPACGHEFGLADANTEVYWYFGPSGPSTDSDCSGVFFGDGTGGPEDFGGRWIWINYVVDHDTGDVSLRLWDRDGGHGGSYFEIPNATDRPTNEIRTIGGYYNEVHPTADEDSRLLLDDLVISADPAEIVPPDGFFGGTGGTAGAGGMATGGAAGSGAMGTGGSAAGGDAGSGGSGNGGAATAGAADPGDDDAGCGCRLAGHRNGPSAPLGLAFMAAALGWAFRSRRHRR